MTLTNSRKKGKGGGGTITYSFSHRHSGNEIRKQGSKSSSWELSVDKIRNITIELTYVKIASDLRI